MNSVHKHVIYRTFSTLDRQIAPNFFIVYGTVNASAVTPIAFKYFN